MPNRKTRDRQLSKLAARRAAERRKKRRQRGIVFGVAGLVAAIGFGVLLVALLHNPKKATSASSSPSPSPEAVACGGSVPSSALVKKPTFTKAPKMTIDPKKTYTATVVTSCGTIQLQLFAKDAPITVNNFVFLANQHFYDGLTFHRIVKGFVIQGGDPKGDGSGSPGYQFKDELNNDLKYDVGTLAMANSGKNTNGSQFFIVSGQQGTTLPKSYTIFGKVTMGTDVVTAIEDIPTTSTSTRQDIPTQTVYILKVTISTS
jgi:cyclophilin family peptidyl-prolyl cis-trans isomerase